MSLKFKLTMKKMKVKIAGFKGEMEIKPLAGWVTKHYIKNKLIKNKIITLLREEGIKGEISINEKEKYVV